MMITPKYNLIKTKKMSTKRKKKAIISGVTRDEAEQAFARYAKADASINKMNAEIDLQCAKVRERYQDKISVLSTEREEAFDTLQSFACEHQSELFSRKKSLEMAHGVIGFRTGTPKLKTLKGFTWASALRLVKEFLPGYIRTTDEIAKDKLLADRDTQLKVSECDGQREVAMSDQMAKCGIVVSQDETFYVEPKQETAD